MDTPGLMEDTRDAISASGATVTRQIALCWLAHALSSSARRLRVQAPSVVRVELLSVRPAADPTDTLASLVRALQHHEDVQDVALTITSVPSIQELPRHHPQEPDAVTIRLVCMETTSDAWVAMQPILETVATTAPATTVVLFVGAVITDKGISVRTAAYPSSSLRSSVDRTALQTALQPLRDLQHQCGLPMALELLASTDPSFGQSRTPTKASHMPFQLLLMLLRWSYFHPRVVSLVATPFIRKLTLIPQCRVQGEILEMFRLNRRLWIHVCSTAEDSSVQKLEVSLTQTRVHHFQLPAHAESQDDDDDDDDSGLPPLRRLSECALWDLQKQFYRDQGIQAWSNHLIPFGVSSSSFLARQYARLAVDFFTLQFCSSTPGVSPPQAPNCYVWEAASGSCKFLHAFLLHFHEILIAERLEERLGIVPWVVATDLSDQVLQSREEMACFQAYVADRRLDFALFDTDSFLDGPQQSSLYLRHAQRHWRVGQDGGPVFVIGNYFFDSLRADVLVATQHQQSNGSTPSIEIREALIDAQTDHIPDMLFSLHKLSADPRGNSVYGRTALDTTLAATVDQLEQDWSTQSDPVDTVAKDSTSNGDLVTRSSLILFPTEAIRLLDLVLGSTFPVAVIAGDATFNFRDAVPSSFIDQDTGDLEIPQLSPHPDCFCLPVDFEILQHFVTSSSSHGGLASIVSTPSSDTFNVFFAQSSSCQSKSQVELDRRFREAFDRFTPCDCDLLWGMMRVDDGTKALSITTQLALLAQTAWDFDVFSVVQWGLLRHFKSAKKSLRDVELDQDGVSGSNAKFDELERLRSVLAGAGRKSARTFYVLDERSRSHDNSAAIATLQLARWFFELNDFESVATVLESFDYEHPRLRAGSLYLLGLASYHTKDFWAALGWFRKGLQLEPQRLRLKKWVARTLLRLQGTKTSTTSSTTVPLNMN